jgi:hypothetical protein
MNYKTIDNHRSENATGQSAADQRGLEEATRDRIIAGEKKSEEGESIEWNIGDYKLRGMSIPFGSPEE